jgi:hypothetical protein
LAAALFAAALLTAALLAAALFAAALLTAALLTAALLTAALLAAALLTPALLTATLLAAALLTATLLTATLPLFVAILLSALLFGAGRSLLVWIFFVHNAFLCYGIRCLGCSHTATHPFSIKSARGGIWTETPNRIRGWLLYKAKSYRICDNLILPESAMASQLAFGSVP